MKESGHNNGVNQVVNNSSHKLLTRYMEHTALGHEMGFAAITRKDFEEGRGFIESFDRLVKRTVAFEMGDGYIPQEPNFELTKSQYAFGIITLARWLPICMIQLSGAHELFVRMSMGDDRAKKAIGKLAIMSLGEGLYWAGYLFPFCNDMNPELPVGLDEKLTLREQAGQEANRTLWDK